jgi:hypothetical protein
MSYPEIIFIFYGNNPSPFLQKHRLLLKDILNKSSKTCQRSRVSSDSSEGFFLTAERRKAR